MCHLRHHAMAIPSPRRACRTSPPVDFTAMADAAGGGLQVLGYTSQARS